MLVARTRWVVPLLHPSYAYPSGVGAMTVETMNLAFLWDLPVSDVRSERTQQTVGAKLHFSPRVNDIHRSERTIAMMDCRAMKRGSHVHVDMSISINLVTTNPIEIAWIRDITASGHDGSYCNYCNITMIGSALEEIFDEASLVRWGLRIKHWWSRRIGFSQLDWLICPRPPTNKVVCFIQTCSSEGFSDPPDQPNLDACPQPGVWIRNPE